MNTDVKNAQRLLVAGTLLLLLGLLTGIAVGAMQNPRMGLSSHLQGITNGLFLMALGLMWARIALGNAGKTFLFYLALYGTYANWLATLLAGIWGAGGKMMPLAAADRAGTALQEQVIGLLLLSLSGAMILCCMLMLWGLIRSGGTATQA